VDTGDIVIINVSNILLVIFNIYIYNIYIMKNIGSRYEVMTNNARMTSGF